MNPSNKAPATSWLWPDRVIGKRESRDLREEHNTLVNDYLAVQDTLHDCAIILDTVNRQVAGRSVAIRGVLDKARAHLK